MDPTLGVWGKGEEFTYPRFPDDDSLGDQMAHYIVRSDVPALLAALAAERDRADRAEARIAEAWDEGVDATFYDPESLGKISWGDNPYRSEATA